MVDSAVFIKIGKERKSASRTQIILTLVSVAAILLAILFHFVVHPLKIAPQPALFMEYGRLMLEGERPYLDFFDYVFPPIMFLYTIPNMVSKYFSIHPVMASNLFVWFILTVSLSISGLLLFTSRLRDQSLSFWFLIGFAASNFLFIPQFGEPHHLMILFTAPYFLSRVLASGGDEVDIRILGVTGTFAAFGFSLDLIFLFVYLSFEILLALKEKSFQIFSKVDFSACFLTLILIGAVYISHFEASGKTLADFPMNMMLLEFDTWIDSMGYVKTTPDLREYFYITIVVFAFSMGLNRWSKFFFPLNLLIVIGFGTFILQGKMYTYQALLMFIPAIVAFSIVCGIIINRIFSQDKFKYSGHLAAILVIISSLGYIFNQLDSVKGKEQISLSSQGYRGSAPREDLSIFHETLEKYSSPGDRVMVLNDQVLPGYPLLLQMGRKPGSGFLCGRLLFITHKIRHSKPVEMWRRTVLGEDYVYQNLIRDIRDKKSKLIIINHDTMAPVLEEKKIIALIKENYEPVSNFDWYQKNWQVEYPDLEYLGYKTSLEIFKRKD